MQTARQVAHQISSARHILAVCHISPDGDAIGSLLALGLALAGLDKRVTLACADPVPEECRHLPHWESILTPDALSQGSPQPPYDLVVSLDCSDLDRLGAAYDPGRLAGVPIVNVDHHRTNVQFGTLNWVEPTAAATAQLIVRLVDALEARWTPEIATCLLNGLVTDTLAFRTSNTTAQVLETAVRMMNAGASLVELTDRAFNHRPLGTIQLWSRALQHLHFDDRILWGHVTLNMKQESGYQGMGDAGLVNFMNTADEADMAVVFIELADGQIDVSMRSAPGYDVSQVALELGGGGHAQAAGCTVPGPLEAAERVVLARLHRARRAQRPSTPPLDTALDGESR